MAVAGKRLRENSGTSGTGDGPTLVTPNTNIKTEITFEGTTYNLDDRDRVAAQLAHDSTFGLAWSGSGETATTGIGSLASSGEFFVTSSEAVATAVDSTSGTDYVVLCLKK